MSHWNFTDDNGVGDWSPAGCSFQGIEDGIVTCHCTHLTNFAILMVRFSITILSKIHRQSINLENIRKETNSEITAEKCYLVIQTINKGLFKLKPSFHWAEFCARSVILQQQS